MNQNKHILLASIENKKDQDNFLQALTSIRIHATVKCVDGSAQLKNYLLSLETNPEPSLILLVAELNERSNMSLIKDLKSIEAVKKMPLVVVSKCHDEYQLKNAYALRVASVIKHPTHFDSIVKILQDMDEYWFNTVKLPVSQL